MLVSSSNDECVAVVCGGAALEAEWRARGRQNRATRATGASRVGGVRRCAQSIVQKKRYRMSLPSSLPDACSPYVGAGALSRHQNKKPKHNRRRARAPAPPANTRRKLTARLRRCDSSTAVREDLRGIAISNSRSILVDTTPNIGKPPKKKKRQLLHQTKKKGGARSFHQQAADDRQIFANILHRYI
jgi:hypothetical protein